DDGDAEDVRGDDPGLVLDAAELSDDRGQRRADDRLIERGQEHARHQRAEDRPDELPAQDDGGCGVGRCGAAGWCSHTSTSVLLKWVAAPLPMVTVWWCGWAGGTAAGRQRTTSLKASATASTCGATAPVRPWASQRTSAACARVMVV